MNNTYSRRQFTGTASAAAGLAAFASMGLAGWGKNNPKITSKDMKQNQLHTDVLVIGGGMSGLFAAVKAYDAGANVTMVSKGRLGSSGETPFAKGIFAFDPSTSNYSLDEFVEAVGRSALGTNNPVYTRQLAEQSKARVEELRAWGFFESPLYNEAFSRPINQRHIPFIERVMITHLIKENEKIVGASGFSLDEGTIYFIHAKSVILCTGSGGFKPNGFPINDLTHDGTIMAYNIGAKVTGKEWNDGHPWKTENVAACFDGWENMFKQKPSTTTSVEIHHDLDVELNYMAYTNGNPVKMEPPGQKPEKRNSKGSNTPGVVAGVSSAGMPIHISEGLVPINDKCQSNIPGLYAAGDALGSYMSGAIYIQRGSSLAGSAVQGGVAGQAAAEYSKSANPTTISKNQIDKITNEIFAPLKKESGYSPTYVTHTLQGIMTHNFILYVKKGKLMKAALAYVEELRDHHLPLMRAADLHELRLAHETANMVISAEMKLKASLMRTESRCSHYRLDYPQMDNKNWQAWINIYKGEDGTMKFEKQPFSQWQS
jgi:succinate dehydrogenase/fumarate reductase flavoprotein subunit